MLAIVEATMSDLNELLREYHELFLELQRLEEKKTMLREAISAAIQRRGMPASLALGTTVIRAQVKTTVTVKYDEDGLRERLGDRIHLILDPDAAKIRRHLSELRSALEPFLDTVGSVSRTLVQKAIEEGLLKPSVFAGLYEKQQKNTLFVRVESLPPE